MAVSFIGSGFAEFISLAFYYPFDLIKTRMQVTTNATALSSMHRYNGVLDATLKIMDEHRSNQLQLCVLKEKDKIIKRPSLRERLMDRLNGIRNLYKGGFVFGLSYTAYMAV